MHGGGAVRPTTVGFCPFLKNSKGNPYLIFFLLFPTIVADALMMKRKVKKIVLPPLGALLFWVGKIAHALGVKM